jgi:hypothetical protein
MITVHTAAERPDLWKVGSDAPTVWPEYNHHGDVMNQWWGRLDEELPEFQFVLYDDDADSVLAQGFTGPLAWTGQDETLPDGIDTAIEQIIAQRRSRAPVSALSALAAEIQPGGRGRGLATAMLAAMREIAQRKAPPTIAPVGHRRRYPLTRLRTTSGGGERTGNCSTRGCARRAPGRQVATPLPRSLRITGHRRRLES